MKSLNRLFLPFVASLSLATVPFVAAEPSARPFAIHATSLVDANSKLVICDGDSEDTVRAALGTPDAVLLDDIWVYRRFAGRSVQSVRYVAQKNGCDATLVAFAPGPGRSGRRVAEIAMVNAAAIDEVAAGLKADPRYLAKQIAAARGNATMTANGNELPYLIHVTSVVTNDDTTLFRDGDSEERVRQAVGQPTEVLPGEVWAFRQFERHGLTEVRHVSQKSGCNVALVSFSPGAAGTGRTVTAIVMVNPASLEAIVAGLKQDPDYLVKRVQAWHAPAM